MWTVTDLTAVVYLALRLGIPFTYDGDPNSTGKGLNFAVSGTSTGEGAGRSLPTSRIAWLRDEDQIENSFRLLQERRYSEDSMRIKAMYFSPAGSTMACRPDRFVRPNIEAG